MAEEAGGSAGRGSSVEVRARTVDEAVARGLVRLGGLSRSEVEIEILSEGKSGVLGFGAEEAVVRLTVRGAAPRPAPGEEAKRPSRKPAAAAERKPLEAAPAAETEAARPAAATPALAGEAVREGVEAPEGAVRIAGEVTGRYLDLLGFEDVSVQRGDSLLPVDVEGEESVVLNVSGAGTRRLLKNDGQPLLALQFLIRLAVNREAGRWVNLLLDVDGDRARRVTELFDLAEQSAALVDREGRPVALPPMTAYERRVVHLALRDHPDVTTQSIGRGETRKVTVRLKGQLLPGV